MININYIEAFQQSFIRIKFYEKLVVFMKAFAIRFELSFAFRRYTCSAPLNAKEIPL